MPTNVVRIILLSLALTATPGQSQRTHADEVPWSTDIEGSLRQAAASGKPVLMEFTASWCVYCKRMEKTTFTDPAVASHINEHFISVRVDADKNKELVTDLSIKGLPAILVVSPDLQIIERISGFQTPQALMEKLARVTADGKQANPDSSVVAAPNRRPLPNSPQPETRQELTFEPITHEEAAPQRRPENIHPVSKPAALTGNSSPHLTSTGRPNPATSGSRGDEFFNAISSSGDSEDSTSGKQPEAGNERPAFRGSCLVSAVEDRQIVPGDAQFQVNYRGHVLYFRSEDHKQRFLAQPGSFWPMMDGCCPMTLLNDNKKVEGELQYAAVFRKRIWLFVSLENMREFFNDPAAVVEEITEQYPSP